LIQFIFSILILEFILPESLIEILLVGEDRLLILLALLAAFSQNVVWPIASGMAEAQRETIKVQKIALVITFMHLIIVCLLWTIGRLAIPTLFIALAIEWGLGGFYAIKLYNNYEKSDSLNKTNSDTLMSVLGEFWRYCAPLIPYAWMSFFYSFADRWMLQHWGGSSEQAYYALARQFGTLTLLATSSILLIFWKEIAEAYYQNNLDKVKRLYKNISHALYAVGVLFAGAVVPWSKEILELFVGVEYVGGSMVLILMLIYTVHQSMGQIGSSMLYATKETKLQTMIGMIFMSVSLIVSYFMMAPSDSPILPGLGLASEGLALKMVMLQIIQVNILAWFISRKFGWKYDWTYQVVILGSVLIVSWLIKAVVQLLAIKVITSMIIFGFIYTLLGVLLIYFKPSIIALNNKELREIILLIMSRISPSKYETKK
jgi:O-antigen/teichoic acid export membrane protein